MYYSQFNRKEENFYFGILKDNTNDKIIFLNKEIFLIGRTKSCDFVINHQSVSKEHASIEYENGEVLLRDLNSSNGSLINDIKIKDGTLKKLIHLDRLKFGKDNTIYLFESNLNNSTQIDNTLIFQSIIKDDKISLVNEEFYSKATRNHLAKENSNMNRIKNPNSSNLITNLPKLSNSSLKFKQINNQTESPKFNQRSEEDNLYKNNKDSNELDLTFKNSQQNLYSSDNLKQTLDELKSRLEKLKIENENLTKTIIEHEEKSVEKTNANKQLLNDLDQINEEMGKLNAKHNALLIYASDLQKKLDVNELEASERKEEINRLLNSDWGKIINEKEFLIKILQKELKFFKEEFENKIKTNSNEKDFDNNNKNIRLENLVDSYIQEIKQYKRIIEDYKSRENECNKKWNELIKENNANIEKINMLQLQLDKQSAQINNVIGEYDMRVVDALNKIPKSLEDFDENKFEAAEYLVEQMNFIMEENRRLIEDNLILENKIEMTNFEIDKLKNENKNLLCYFEINSESEYQNDNKIKNCDGINQNFNLNVKFLYMKIEELEDVLTQYKNINSPIRIIDMEQSYIELNNKIAERDNQIEQLNRKFKEFIKNSNLLFDESEAINSISKVLSERDMIILNLRNQIKEINCKIDESERKDINLNEECKDYIYCNL